ncbi:TPA: exonuclease, partial [Pseudomonas aeruginosa]
RAYRDEEYICKLADRVKTFYEIMEARMERVLAA